MKTEEGRPTVCNLAFIDPKKPDPEPPPLIRLPRWTYYPLAKSLPLTVRNLAKLAPALNPYAANIAIWSSGGTQPIIHGFTDQQTLFRQRFEFEETSGWARPGLFHIDILGVGSLAVYDSDKLIAAVRHDDLVTETVDVFSSKLLQRKLTAVFDFDQQHKEELLDTAIECICRILIRMRRFRHGGALLIDDRPPPRLLRLKHTVAYTKLGDAVRQYVRELHTKYVYFDYQATESLEEAFEHLRLHTRAQYEVEDAQEAMLGCVGLVASLTRVDGVVQMGNRCCIRGFGGEITAKQEPSQVRLSRTIRASNSTILSPTDFGTRHRSMFRYCWARPESVGIVVSQDGDVRVMTRMGNRVMTWENVRIENIQTLTFSKRYRK